jgi:hypothetical protein
MFKIIIDSVYEKQTIWPFALNLKRDVETVITIKVAFVFYIECAK